MIFQIPTEIISRILREATLVPGALDTSPSIFFEDRDAVIQLVRDSMTTKVSLSLVSKSFDDVMETYLYEIVMLFRFEYVPVLLRRLRTTRSGFRSPRGHKCRRLDFYLGIGNIPYSDEAWYEGGHTLWGLISACPNLEILMARVARSVPGLDYPRLTHKALWMTIAACCAKTIRRLELYGFGIRMDRVEMMLRYLTKLEACRIIGAREFDPNQDIYDDEEPKERLIMNGHRSVTLMDRWDYSKMSGWFDTSIVREFKAARENSHWPPFLTSAPYILPCLHTLRLDITDLKRLPQFIFPRLRHLDMTCFFEDDDSGGLDFYANSDHFPASITHLIYAGENISFVQFFRLFPHLRQLTVAVEYSSIPSSEYEYIAPHPNLEVVEMASWDSTSHPQLLIQDILTAVRARKLPNLRLIKLTPPWKYKEELPFEECEASGVRLEVVLRPKPTFCGMRKRHHA
ncbi:hypothetical protein J132_06110 [Termitomyces sp. J132]|nr:hypothetical protein H2248_009235 [Termitomyces sp. 'cryptogamus']KNZ80373.1 hypothetical protein J132_06110 [Termitomyces sp. J132]